jgi:SET domain-containing protein
MTHKLARSNGLHVGPSRLGGRGLFSGANIAAGDLVTSTSVLVLPPEQTGHVDEGMLRHYVFDWTPDAETAQYALAFGEISFCNHSAQPNCRFELDREQLCVRLYAARDVKKGEELTIDYAYEEFPFEVVEG